MCVKDKVPESFFCHKIHLNAGKLQILNSSEIVYESNINRNAKFGVL